MKIACFLLMILMSGVSYSQQKYSEKYRPQFHISPSSGFMGDPCGTIKYKGDYHFFWWGHLRSTDLVYWTELNTNSLKGTPSGFGNWTGSAVMDLNNTSGFGLTPDKPPMVAIYTLNDNVHSIQHQAISSSLNYGSFNYYSGNPVITSNLKDFRDPSVFWYAPTQKWIMVIVKPIDKAIEFYSSPNLKTWTYESKFTGRGAEKEVWEVPDMFQLPLNGDTTNKKWLLTCGMGPNRMQFWVGSFDGHTFSLDPEDNLMTGKHFDGEVFENFEQFYQGWTVVGTAFGSGPAHGALPNQQPVHGYSGNGFVNSFFNGDGTVGKMTSSPFTITKKHLNALIGGGSNSKLAVRLKVNGTTIATLTSPMNSESLRWRGVNISQWIGQTAQIEIIDSVTGGWGHVLVDHITQSDLLYDTRVENANWADWGPDFYAGKVFNNYDTDPIDKRKIWLAWMGNWTYANSVPTVNWKGCESLPRELSLVNNGKGYRLRQKPIAEFEKLRKDPYVLNNTQFIGTHKIEAFKPEWNVYEAQVSFRISRKDQVFGINLAEGTGQKIVITYDAKSSNISVQRPVDRFGFSGIREARAPVKMPEDSILKIHIFLDQSSLEVFANDYETAITSLTFLDTINKGISLFSNNGDVLVPEFKAWPLKSIWGVQPPKQDTTITNPDTTKPQNPDTTQPVAKKKVLYPNPVSAGDSIYYYLMEDATSIGLYDGIGKRLFGFDSAKSGALRLPGDLSAGIYYLKIDSPHGKEINRVVVTQRE